MGIATKDAVVLAQKMLHDQVVGQAGGNLVKAVSDPIKATMPGFKDKLNELYGPEKQQRDLINLYEELGDPPIPHDDHPILGGLPSLPSQNVAPPLKKISGKLNLTRDYTGN